MRLADDAAEGIRHNPCVIDAPHPAATHVTPYDRLEAGDAAVERLLASGAQREALTDYFGAAAYAELAALARRATRARSRGGSRVYILPGIMGSLLGRPRGHGLPNDILWLDPIDIAVGRLREIVLRPHSPVRAMGAILYHFLKLKLRLAIAGFSPRLSTTTGGAASSTSGARSQRKWRTTHRRTFRSSRTAWADSWRAPRWRCRAGSASSDS